MEEERAHSNAAECPTFALRRRELPAAARKSELPLSRFPRWGKAGAGGFPPRRWHAVRQQTALAHIDAAAPPARGVSKRSLENKFRRFLSSRGTWKSCDCNGITELREPFQ